jgi:hypothetical protein
MRVNLTNVLDEGLWIGGKTMTRDSEIEIGTRRTDCGQMTTQLGTPRGRYDEHINKFSLSKKPRFIEPVGKSQTSEDDAC